MRVLYITLFVFIADQVSKLFVKGFKIPSLGIEWEGMFYGQSIELIGDFLKLTFVENPGMAFGIDVGEGSKLLLSLFSLAASIGILIYLYKLRNERFIVRLSLALILAGALGNFIDRAFYGVLYDYAPLFYGKVVDFINVEFWDFTIMGRTYERWPIFNFADAAVTVGVILLIIFHREEKKEVPKDGQEKIKTQAVEPKSKLVQGKVDFSNMGTPGGAAVRSDQEITLPEGGEVPDFSGKKDEQEKLPKAEEPEAQEPESLMDKRKFRTIEQVDVSKSEDTDGTDEDGLTRDERLLKQLEDDDGEDSDGKEV